MSYVIKTSNTDAHRNLAYEHALLLSPPFEGAGLFLWQNAHTVVIGAGQNAWRECDVTRLRADGGTLARRSSGGGAVYHDLGNLNFSFIMPNDIYDVKRQLSVVINALERLGIPARAEGRNDVTVNGKKFSGNAFRVMKDMSLHHGTILVCADLSKMPLYLTASNDKFEGKGVKSVRARVMNLSEVCDITVDTVSDALAECFFREYGAGAVYSSGDIEPKDIGELYQKYESWDWNLGASPKGEITLYRRFDFGGLEMNIALKNGIIDEISVYTDAMDAHLSDVVAAALLGCRWDAARVGERLAMIGMTDAAKWIEGEI